MYKHILFLFTIVFVACEKPSSPLQLPLKFHGKTMGTSYTVKIESGVLSKTLSQDIQKLLEKIDGSMSTYRTNSEVSRFNRAKKGHWLTISKETALVIAKAQEISKKTKGVFDITVGPLVNIWGFGPEVRVKKIPSKKQIEEAKTRVGYQKLHLDLQKWQIKKDHSDLYIDLSAIAKGYAVDTVAKLLEAKKITSYMVEIGGEIRVKGTKKDGSSWKLGIENPVVNSRKIHKVISLKNKAIATSGDYRNYRLKKDGTRFSHAIDPRTGRPIKHHLASITVIADTCMEADALATALMVLGEKEGYTLARKLNLACYFIIRDQGKFTTRETKAFTAIIKQN